MDTPVFFLEKLEDGNIFTLNEDTSRHIIQVLRMKPLEKIQLTNGAGNLVTAEITGGDKRKCMVTVIGRQAFSQKTKQISIGISLLKNAARFEWFLEKATEMGVTEIIPMLCERTEKQHFRYERMRQIIISAMMQSKQVWLPVLQSPVSFETVISSSIYHSKLIAHCEDDNKPSIKNFLPNPPLQILIGPEGDFSQNEISSALKNNFQPVALGDTRLRSETAGVVAAALLCI